MNVARDLSIILGLQIFLDHRSLSSIDQKILMTLDFPGKLCRAAVAILAMFSLSVFLTFRHSVFLSVIWSSWLIKVHLCSISFVYLSFTGRYWAVVLDGLRSS